MIKSIKIMLKPNNEQNSLLFQCAGMARFAFNWALAKEEENYKAGNKFISDCDLRKELTQLKKTEEFLWLNKYSNDISKQAIKDVCNAYKKFFKGLSKKPKFKSKRKGHLSFYGDTVKTKFRDQHVYLSKIGYVRLKEYNRIPEGSKIVNPRITYDGLNWWISVGIEVPEMDIGKSTEPIGIDLGVKDFAVLSDGRIYKNINKSRVIKRTIKTLKRLQRCASRQHEKTKKKEGDICYEKSANLLKLEKKILKVYKRVSNIRENYIHQITTALVKTKPEYILIEDLNVSGMMKNRHLSKAVMNQKFYEFRRILTYKCFLYGIPLFIADRFYPSSKTCSRCGHIKKDLKLNERVYRCPECGLEIDRDLNAAINLREYPKKLIV
jgi:transposase, IS605 orfB family